VSREVESPTDEILRAARELGHALTNDLQAPFGTLEIVLQTVLLPTDLYPLLHDAMIAIADASSRVCQFQAAVQDAALAAHEPHSGALAS
jgi:hypothetical protein